MRSVVIGIDAAGDDGYPVTFREVDPGCGEGGQSAAERIGTISPEVVETDVVLLARRLQRRYAEPDGRAAVGDELAALLPAGAWPADLAGCPDCGQQSDGHHLVVYFDIKPKCLQALPWELLRGEDRFLFLESGHACVRGAGTPAPAVLTRPKMPIKMLILVGPRVDQVQAELEISGIRQSANRFADMWQISVLRNPDQEQLDREIRQSKPHIFHLIGHAGWVSGQVVAEVEGPGSAWAFGVEQIDQLFPADGPTPGLFVLNGCDSAGMVGGLLAKHPGRRSVIAMQGKIDAEAAALFSVAFYQGLHAGADLAHAVQAGRAELRRLPRDPAVKLDWATPVLTLAPSGAALVHDLCAINAHQTRITPIGRPAGRWPPLDRISEYRVLEGGAPLTGVYGAQGAGKSFLVHRYLRACRLNGELTAFLDLGRREGLWSQREALAQAIDVAGLIEDEYGDRLADRDPEGSCGLAAVFKELVELAAELRAPNPELGVRRAYGRFVALLDKIASACGAPLVFLFDRVERIATESGKSFDEIMLGHRLSTNRKPDASRLIAVADGPGGQGGFHRLSDWPDPHVPTVLLGHYAQTDHRDISRELCARLHLAQIPDDAEEIRARLETMILGMFSLRLTNNMGSGPTEIMQQVELAFPSPGGMC